MRNQVLKMTKKVNPQLFRIKNYNISNYKYINFFENSIKYLSNTGYYFIEDFLIDSPWILVAAIIFLPCFATGGLRLGIYSLFVMYFWGAVGMWNESLQTVGLMGLSVILCVFLFFMIKLYLIFVKILLFRSMLNETCLFL